MLLRSAGVSKNGAVCAQIFPADALSDVRGVWCAQSLRQMAFVDVI